jgi:valyl-tRNA synthetase
LWPISVLDGIRHPENRDFKYYYPTSDLVTAPEILFFWVARMIIAGYEYAGRKPFNNVYLTGIVRDKSGRKMSKSLGNSPDPIELMEKYGADGVRVGMLLCSPAGGDLLFNESLTEQGRNFANKIWNAFRLIKSWKIDPDLKQPEASKAAVKWFNEKLNESIILLEDQFSKYRLSEALMNIYKLFWDEFSSWYLEIIKPAYQQSIDETTYAVTFDFFEKLLKLLHPFVPFITEEIWHLIKTRKNGESIMISDMPGASGYDKACVKRFEKAKETISSIRTIRKEREILIKETLSLLVREEEKKFDNRFGEVLKKLCNLSEISFIKEKPEKAVSFIIKTTEYYIPVGDKVNIDEELSKLKKDLEYNKGFLAAVMKKLDNKSFVKNAPQNVVNREKEKKADTEAKILALQEQINALL